MHSLLAPQQLQLFEYAGGTSVIITFPITATGKSTDTVVTMYIYEGSLLSTHGTLLASTSQEVHFDKDVQKDVAFVHVCQQTSQSKRDVGLEIAVDDKTVCSVEWDDLFSVESAPGILDTLKLIPAMMTVMMMSLVMSTMEEE